MYLTPPQGLSNKSIVSINSNLLFKKIYSYENVDYADVELTASKEEFVSNPGSFSIFWNWFGFVETSNLDIKLYAAKNLYESC